MHTVLIIDDETVFARNVQLYLGRRGYEVSVADDADTGLTALERDRPDIVLLDYRLPDQDGLSVLRRIRENDAAPAVVFMTGHGSIQIAIDAMKGGAVEYLTKPVALEELGLLLDKLLRQQATERNLEFHRDRIARDSGLQRLLGESPPMIDLRKRIAHYLRAETHLGNETPPPVLVTGETGTGKEIVARAFHFDGVRRDRSFIDINCAAIPAQLVEAELLGYERGAFTDARQRKLGLVESAQGGTLFLDEIGETELALQTKLLGLLENKRIRRLGGIRDLDVDVRVIAATNRDLENDVAAGRFRMDLLFRLRVVHVHLPPLRQRGDDILLLARHFLDLHAARYGRGDLELSREAQTILTGYAWPGNVRELKNMLEHAVLVCNGMVVNAQDLSLTAGLETHDHHDLNLARAELHNIRQALRESRGNVSRAAQLLGLTRDAMRYRMKKYSIDEH